MLGVKSKASARICLTTLHLRQAIAIQEALRNFGKSFEHTEHMDGEEEGD